MSFVSLVIRCLIVLCLLACNASPLPASSESAVKEQQEAVMILPPWQGEHNPAEDRGVIFTVAGIESIPDFHGDPTDARLVIFSSGNYFFVLDELVATFEKVRADLKGRIFYETLPSGIVLRQIDAGAITVGNMTLALEPDVVQLGRQPTEELISRGLLLDPAAPFALNTLAIMIPAGNPGGVKSLVDLAQPGVRLAIPNPETEGIAQHFQAALRKAGGEALVMEVYENKVKRGEAVITEIHHRQTPLLLMAGNVHAGVTTLAEARYHAGIGHPIVFIAIPDEHNQESLEFAAVARNANHPESAHAWLEFIRSEAAREILLKYGMEPPARQPPPKQ